MLKGMAAGNLLLASAILLSGATYTKIASLSELEIEDLWLSGDGWCDSPGHSAKYGTYTMIDQLSDFQIVQVSEVTSSNAMEREGFKRCMENIQRSQHKSSRHRSPCQYTVWHEKDFPHLQHQFDVWYVAKSISKKLTEKAKRRRRWLHSISRKTFKPTTGHRVCSLHFKGGKNLHEQCSCYFSFGKISSQAVTQTKEKTNC